MTPLAAALIGLARVYQWTVRPIIGPNCRFWPSCSEYAVEAVAVHGALTGGGLAARRVLRCNPWHPGGYDPIPPCACAESSPRMAFPLEPSGEDDVRQPRHAAVFPQRLDAAEPNPKAL